MAARLTFVVRGTPSARRERGELSFAPAPVLQAQRRPFEQSLEPLRPNAVIDRTSTPGARPKRLSSPLRIAGFENADRRAPEKKPAASRRNNQFCTGIMVSASTKQLYASIM
jgi:hypothetical protein